MIAVVSITAVMCAAKRTKSFNFPAYDTAVPYDGKTRNYHPRHPCTFELNNPLYTTIGKQWKLRSIGVAIPGPDWTG